jgi:arsenate reductase
MVRTSTLFNHLYLGLRGENVVWFINPEHRRGGMRLLFVCVGNTCRSQMAEALAKHKGHEAQSAGTSPGDAVAPEAIEVIGEKGIDMDDQYPKSVDDIDTRGFDRIISMGCGVEYSHLPMDDDWGIEDPHGGDVSLYRGTRDKIEGLLDLLE